MTTLLVLLAFEVLAIEVAQGGSFSCKYENGEAPVMHANDEHECEPITQGMSFMQIDLVVSRDEGESLSSHDASEDHTTLKSVNKIKGALLLLQQTRHTVIEKLRSQTPFGGAEIAILVVVIVAVPTLAAFCFLALWGKTTHKKESEAFLKRGSPPWGSQTGSPTSASSRPSPAMPNHRSSSVSSAAMAPYLGMRPIRYSDQSAPLTTLSSDVDSRYRPQEVSNVSSVLGTSALRAQALRSQNGGYGGDFEPIAWPQTDESLKLPVSPPPITPLCGDFVMPDHETRFMVPIESVKTWQKDGGRLGIMGSFQYPLLFASISKCSDGLFVDMSTTPEGQHPAASIGPLDNSGPLRLTGKDGQLYGMVVKSPLGYELKREGQPNLQVIQHDPSKSRTKLITLQLATGQSFASVELSSLNHRFSDSVIVFSCNPGSDGVLVALTSLACIYMNATLLTLLD